MINLNQIITLEFYLHLTMLILINIIGWQLPAYYINCRGFDKILSLEKLKYYLASLDAFISLNLPNAWNPS